MLADAVVNALVVAAENDDILAHRQAVSLVLVVGDAIGRGVDNLVVLALGLQLLNKFEYGLALDHHTRLATEGVVVRSLALVVGIVVQVMHNDFNQTLLLRTFQD